MQGYTAIVRQDGPWWVGWIEEIPGGNCQESTRDQLIETLRETLREPIDMNRQDALRSASGDFTEETIAV
jgi:hypothetical protein